METLPPLVPGSEFARLVLRTLQTGLMDPWLDDDLTAEVQDYINIRLGVSWTWMSLLWGEPGAPPIEDIPLDVILAGAEVAA